MRVIRPEPSEPVFPAKNASIVKVNATLQDFEGDIGRGVAFSLTKRCV